MRRRIASALLSALMTIFFALPALAFNFSHQCSYCHNVHSLIPPQDLVETLCLTCHGPGGISILKADVHTNKLRSSYPAFRIGCVECHDPHDNLNNWLGGRNLELVGTVLDSFALAKIVTPNSGVRDVVFESRGVDSGGTTLHSFADADEDNNGIYDGICEVCHTLTKFHRNDGSAGTSHNRGKDCTACHAHINGFNRR